MWDPQWDTCHLATPVRGCAHFTWLTHPAVPQAEQTSPVCGRWDITIVRVWGGDGKMAARWVKCSYSQCLLEGGSSMLGSLPGVPWSPEVGVST